MSRRAWLSAAGLLPVAAAGYRSSAPTRTARLAVSDLVVPLGGQLPASYVDVTDSDDLPVPGCRIAVYATPGLELVDSRGRLVSSVSVVSSRGGRATLPSCVVGTTRGVGHLTVTPSGGTSAVLRVEMVSLPGMVLGFGRSFGAVPQVVPALAGSVRLAGGSRGLFSVAGDGAMSGPVDGSRRTLQARLLAARSTAEHVHIGGQTVLTVSGGQGEEIGSLGRRTLPVLPGLISAVALGRQRYMLDADGTLWCWGGGAEHPLQIPGPTGVVSLTAGLSAAYATTSEGAVWSWGADRTGQLGRNAAARFDPDPGLVAGLPSAVTRVVATAASAYALLDDGTVWSWGADDRGQRGTARRRPGGGPTQIDGLPSMVAVIGAGRSAMAIGADGSLWGWGRNDAGQLGDGSTTDRPRPVHVEGVGVVRDAATDGRTTLVLT